MFYDPNEALQYYNDNCKDMGYIYKICDITKKKQYNIMGE